MPSYLTNPLIDSVALANHNRSVSQITRERAVDLAAETVDIGGKESYVAANGEVINISQAIIDSANRIHSVPPLAQLVQPPANPAIDQSVISVENRTTQAAAYRLKMRGHIVLALNFADGTNPGSDFLQGGRSQEASLCRDSLLYKTLLGQPFYDIHNSMDARDVSDWCIVSQDVPFIRNANGDLLDLPWTCDVLTCAAPTWTPSRAAHVRDLFAQRIYRVLEVASSLGYTALVLGAWGCGLLGNDATETAKVFRTLLQGEFCGRFGDIVFAITDWSPERKFLASFAQELMSGAEVLPEHTFTVYQTRQPSQLKEMVADNTNHLELLACAAYAVAINTFNIAWLDPWLDQNLVARSSATCRQRMGSAEYMTYYAPILANWKRICMGRAPIHLGEIAWHYNQKTWCVLLHTCEDGTVYSAWIPTLTNDKITDVFSEIEAHIKTVNPTGVFPTGRINDLDRLLAVL